MRKICSLFLLYFLCLSPAYTYTLNGSMVHNGGGTYNVLLRNNFGHEFAGLAEDQGNGTFDLAVEDEDGEAFVGTALDNDNGGYILNMENEETGVMATGFLRIEE